MQFHLNLALGWLWLFLSFVSGMGLGLFFHRKDWLGGYGSFKRRLYRLAHISFFGLGAANLLFWLTAKSCVVEGWTVTVASWVLVVGTVSMPLCCVVMAHVPGSRMLFAIPVLSLITGGLLTLLEVMKL